MERIGEGIERELGRSAGNDVVPLTRLTALWPSTVGPEISRQAWPLRIGRDGTLHVATASATWANELTMLANEILERLREQLGPEAPAALRCAVGPIPEAPAPESEAVTTQQPADDVPPDIASTAASVASAIADPELRELVARAARASLVRGASDRHF